MINTKPDDPALDELVALLTRVSSCAFPSFSPDGTRIAFISTLSGIPQVWMVDAESGWPDLVTALEDPIVGARWSPNGEWLAISVAPGGGMNSQIYAVRPDGTDLRRLTPGGSSNNWLGDWMEDGRELAIASSARDPGTMDTYLVAVASGEMRLVAENPGTGHITDLSADGRYAILARVENRSDNNLSLVDLRTGSQLLLTPHDPPGNFNFGEFGADGFVYLASDLERDLTAFARIPVVNGQPGSIEIIAERPDAEADGLWLTQDGKTAVLLWNSWGSSELELLDLATGRRRGIEGLPGELVLDAEWSPDGAQLAVTVSGAAMPADIWILEIESGGWHQVTHSPHPGVDLSSLIQPELVRFSAHDGLELSGWLHTPHDYQAPGPLVLDFHGGPEGQSRPFFNATYQALLSQGIAVFAPNVRGSTGQGKTFVNLDNGPLRFDAVRDIAACLDFVTRAGIADPSRIGIMGGSYGGYMTMAGLVEYPDRFAAGANLFGIVNFETFFAQTEPWMAAISKIEYGDPDTEPDLLRRLSPIHRIDRVRAPTLVLHGANDTNVPVVEAEQVVGELERRGVPVKYILFSDEGHGFRKLPNRITATVAIVRWFVEHLRIAP